MMSIIVSVISLAISSFKRITSKVCSFVSAGYTLISALFKMAKNKIRNASFKSLLSDACFYAQGLMTIVVIWTLASVLWGFTFEKLLDWLPNFLTAAVKIAVLGMVCGAMLKPLLNSGLQQEAADAAKKVLNIAAKSIIPYGIIRWLLFDSSINGLAFILTCVGAAFLYSILIGFFTNAAPAKN